MAFFPPQRIRATSETFSFPIVTPGHNLFNDNVSATTYSTAPLLKLNSQLSHHLSQDWLRRHATPLIVRRERIIAALIWLKAHNVMTSMCETVVGIAARRPSVTL